MTPEQQQQHDVLCGERAALISKKSAKQVQCDSLALEITQLETQIAVKTQAINFINTAPTPP